MNLEQKITTALSQAFSSLFSAAIPAEQLLLQPTRKEFEGTYTFVTFPFLSVSKKKPEETAELLGNFLLRNLAEVSGFNVVKGFLNLVIAEQNWVKQLVAMRDDPDFGQMPSSGMKVMVEYSSPNTNKPLHLGHLRNNFLGFSVAAILKAAGHEVLKVNLVNDRGVHICKSMLAYQKFGKGETPASGEKGDKLVGRYYVRFDTELRKQAEPLMQAVKAADFSPFKPEVAEKLVKLVKAKTTAEQELENSLGADNPKSGAKKALQKKISGLTDDIKQEVHNQCPIMDEVRAMLQAWEAHDPEVRQLWQTMNGWVYEGFDQTYKSIGVDFNKIYYESDTYLLGKDIIEEGLQKKVFFQKADGSVWADLTDNQLDEKLVLRGDGTSVYITQDMGTADLKYQDFQMDSSVHVVGNEQDYHFAVLKALMEKLDRPYASGIYHLSYGMVDLPSGKMKSREGTVVDADDLVAQMIATAKERTAELGKIDDFTKEAAEDLYKQLALGALKYYLLRVDPKRRMLFNPEESIDFQGNTGVYIQYTHAKIHAILRKAQQEGIQYAENQFAQLEHLTQSEQEVVTLLASYPEKIQDAANLFAPSIIANYAYDLAKTYSKFYSEVSIFKDPKPEQDKQAFRILLSEQTARVLAKAMNLLGVKMPEKM